MSIPRWKYEKYDPEESKQHSFISEHSHQSCMKHDCEVKLMEWLLDYKHDTDPALKRKIDYYITPYHQVQQMEKYMTFYSPEDVAFIPTKKKKEPVKIDPLTNLIDRPEILHESSEMKQCKVFGLNYWHYFLKRILQNTNVT